MERRIACSPTYSSNRWLVNIDFLCVQGSWTNRLITKNIKQCFSDQSTFTFLIFSYFFVGIISHASSHFLPGSNHLHPLLLSPIPNRERQRCQMLKAMILHHSCIHYAHTHPLKTSIGKGHPIHLSIHLWYLFIHYERGVNLSYA